MRIKQARLKGQVRKFNLYAETISTDERVKLNFDHQSRLLFVDIATGDFAGGRLGIPSESVEWMEFFEDEKPQSQVAKR